MAGGGNKRRSNNNKNKNSNSNSNGQNKTKSGRGRSKSSSSRIRNSLFVEGGLLSDWQLDSQGPRSLLSCWIAEKMGRNRNGNRISGLGSDRAKASTSKKGPSTKIDGSAIRYEYPSLDLQDPESDILAHKGDNKKDELHPIILLSKESQIVAYMDQTTPSKPSLVNYTYGYGSDFVLGDKSHRGLGFDDESEATPSGIESCSKKMEEQEGACSNLSSSETEADAGHDNNNNNNSSKVDAGVAEELIFNELSQKKNAGFLSIGGVKLYTQDMSDAETDEDYDGNSLGDESSGTTDQEEQDGVYESDDSVVSSDDDSDIDEEVAEDYLEGIGGEDSVLDTKWLVGQALNDSGDDSSSNTSFDGTLEKLGGIALQDASREYGMQKNQSRNKYSGGAKDAWSPALDDLMLVKDPRTMSAKKKHVAKLPRSWPLQEQKSKNSRKFPGEKKKHRKEMIAVKRRERMLRRGVDLEKINLKLEQIVLDQVDMFAFQPMHPRDCSQRMPGFWKEKVISLLLLHERNLMFKPDAISPYRFVTVTWTQYTSMPSSSDKLRLEKLIGTGDEDADFPVNEGFNIKALDSGRARAQKVAKGSGLKKAGSSNIGESGGKRRSGKKVSYVSQPVSFISSGVMVSETDEIRTTDPEGTSESYEHKGIIRSAQFGAFEVHTKGFGSKMMAKMGFVEGGGLGKDGQGMAQPIEVVQRPKSLGLGVNFTSTSSDSDRVHKSGGASENHSKRFGDSSKDQHKSFGAFEKHTKGFGSKMMAKMGFVEGMGLGKDSQGIVNPLVASRLPKSRGLGANH
ncbi:hypothetical protein Gohar_002216 [Gossypium harknessii]|uniref:G-patch domain-containing protein n=1 Tax=Gossypium harknessii TaxID=34285 RepID=A0A7J9HLD3_9ROSI|nr:hypothetical protein [Gossypium harknessii]